MHVFRRARVPLAFLPPPLRAAAASQEPNIEPWLECDVTISGQKITGVAPSLRSFSPLEPPAPDQAPPSCDASTTDLSGALLFPGLLDVHTHLDKAHTWRRAPNPRGEFWDAIRILADDSRLWTEEDLHRRADFSLRCAWAHGTVAMRTHLDTGKHIGEAAHATIRRLREEWSGRIALQTVSLCNLAAFAAGDAARIMEITGQHQATALGGFPQPNPDLPRQLDFLMAAARELRVGLDLHVDESGLAHAECLRATAEAVLRNEFPHPVACGHNCSLALQDPARAASTVDLVRAAGIHIISLPLCNLYLQGRDRAPAPTSGARPPRLPAREHHGRRGLTLLHEFMDAGVTVACGSDNVRDAFHPWGDFDVMEVFHESVRIGHLDTRIADAPAIVTTGPAKIMGLDAAGYGTIAPGAPADLIAHSARTFNELLARPSAPRRLVRGEHFRSRELPDYAELESLLPDRSSTLFPSSPASHHAHL